ncbi:MAG: DUF6174 domain-containing protein [Pseudomonadota bacterium]
MKVKYFPLLIICISVCVFAETPSYSESLAHAKQLWQSKNIYEYSYSLTAGGVFTSREYKIHVKGKTCSAKLKSSLQKEHWEKTECANYTVPELFLMVENELVKKNEKLEVKFNPEFGNLEKIFVEPGGNIEDGLWYVDLTNLKIHPAR